MDQRLFQLCLISVMPMVMFISLLLMFWIKAHPRTYRWVVKCQIKSRFNELRSLNATKGIIIRQFWKHKGKMTFAGSSESKKAEKIAMKKYSWTSKRSFEHRVRVFLFFIVILLQYHLSAILYGLAVLIPAWIITDLIFNRSRSSLVSAIIRFLSLITLTFCFLNFSLWTVYKLLFVSCVSFTLGPISTLVALYVLFIGYFLYYQILQWFIKMYWLILSRVFFWQFSVLLGSILVPLLLSYFEVDLPYEEWLERSAFYTRVHNILCEVPRPFLRKFINIYARPEMPLRIYDDQVQFPEVRGELKPIEIRIDNNISLMQKLLKLPEKMSYIKTCYERTVDLKDKIKNWRFEEFEPIFNLAESQKEILRETWGKSKFVNQMPGKVNVVGETNSTWKQKPLRNVPHTLNKQVSDPVYNTTYLHDTEFQILSTSRYFVGENEVRKENEWESYVDEVYEVLKPWLENSHLKSINQVMSDYKLKYNLGFGAQYGGKAYKRNSIFESCGGLLSGRKGLRDFIMNDVIPRANDFAHISEVFMKEEVLPLTKWPKCRTILGANFFFHLPALMFGSEPNHRAKYYETPICVGMPLTGRYLTPIFQKVLGSYRHFAGDMTAYDSSLEPGILDLVKGLRKKGFENHAQKENIYKYIDCYYETLKKDPLHIKDGGILVDHAKGLATGHPFTSYDNSFTYQGIMYRCLKDLIPEMTPRMYKEDFYMPDYADDNFVCWNRPIFLPSGEELTFEHIQKSILKYNIVLKCENLDASGLPSDEELAYLGNKWRMPTAEESEKYDIPLVIYHDESRLLSKFQMNFKARSPLRRLERCSGYVMNCAHLPVALEIIQEEVANIVQKHPMLKQSVHYRNATLSMDQIIKKWYAPLNKHDAKLLKLIQEDFDLNELQLEEKWDLLDFLSCYELLLEQIPLSLSGVGLNYIGAFNYTYLNRHYLKNFLVAMCLHFQVEIRGLYPFFQRLRLDFLDIQGVYKDFNLISDINTDLKTVQGWSAEKRKLFSLPYLNMLKVYHILSYFVPFMPVLNVFRLVISCFNISLSKLASINFLITGNILDYNQYTLFNPVSALIFSVLLAFVETWPDAWEIMKNIQDTRLQQIVDHTDFFFQDCVDFNLGKIANTIKYNSIPEVQNHVDKLIAFDEAIDKFLYDIRPSDGAFKHKLLLGRTGFGKTTDFILRMEQNLKVPRVIVVIPKRVAVLSIYKYMSTKHRDVGCWTQGSPKTTGKIIYATPDAFMCRYNQLDASEIVCIDEAHFKNDGYFDFVKFMNEASKFRRILFMTATPDTYLTTTLSEISPKVKGAGCEINYLPEMSLNWGDYMDLCSTELRRKTTDRTLIFVNTKEQQLQLSRKFSYRKVCVLNSDNVIEDPEAQIILTTSVCDVAITLKDVTKVITHDLELLVDEQPFYVKASKQTMTQRAGRTGRTADGSVQIVKIRDRGIPKPVRSFNLLVNETLALMLAPDYYRTLSSEIKQQYRIELGIDGAISMDFFLNKITGESGDQKSGNSYQKGEIEDLDNDFIEYTMKMDNQYYEELLTGFKTRELRIARDKFAKWKVGDQITVLNANDQSRSALIKINDIQSYQTLPAAVNEHWTDIHPSVFNEKDSLNIFRSFPGYEGNARQFGVRVYGIELLSEYRFNISGKVSNKGKNVSISRECQHRPNIKGQQIGSSSSMHRQHFKARAAN